MEKNYRIHTNITKDTVLNVNMQQDYDFLEVLSLKLRTSDAYRLHSSNYGVVIGRVLANDAFGIPNARVSVFVPRDRNDATYIESIYPYTEVMDRDRDGRRYNLLPDTSDDDCYRVVGTFPNKRLVLDDDVQLDIYDRYYKFSTVTNNAGDYMIFGLPSGNQQIHVDIDLSDIGILSQTPRDFLYKGYNITMFDSPRQFKESTNLENLAQLFSQNKSVYVYPFWGDSDLNNGIAAITRCDIQIQYKFEPTCVFMGSIISDNEGNSIGSRCDMAEDNGMNYQLIAGEGTIEMIRKTPDGLVEEFPIQGNQLIDSDGVWCYQIPMNLDYVGTDEYGNIIPTDNPSKGIPTRTQVRFRISKSETGNEGHSRHTAKYLVPMNPPLKSGNRVNSVLSGKEVEDMYKFGSATPQSCFRDLYWNNVYSVKNYIPKSQVANRPYSPNYTALKGSNLATDQNPIPFNKLRIDLPFVYAVVCIIFDILITIVTIINAIMSVLHWMMVEFCLFKGLSIFGISLEVCPFGLIFANIFKSVGLRFTCVSLGGGLSDDNMVFYPGCSKATMEDSSCPDGMDGCEKSNNKAVLRDRIQQKLAEDYKIVKLDFYQDWLNGALYMPLWYWRKSKKKKFLFFTIASAKNEYCDCNKGIYSRLKTYVTCNFKYTNDNLGVNNAVTDLNEDNWHRNKGRADSVYYSNGLIKAVENDSGLKAYYYTAMNPTSNAGSAELKQLGEGFPSIILYATDIILLGNLNENNIYGIPQLFNNLPSTTANIPPIATRDDGAGNDSDSASVLNGLINDEANGNSVTTGMDWLHDGDESSPQYKNGLFMDLLCTSVKTRAKSCINAERLSELGMNLDMEFGTEYPSGNQLKQGTFLTDGFVTKIELDDIENRAMFATLNHVGFMPQDFQDVIRSRGGERFDTQILDESGYYIPKFKYLYPLDLDGRMQPSLDSYRNGFQQSMYDHQDQAYLDFRLGDSGYRHFYNGFSMPLYKNSFYFYFGVNKGSTAIEKFRKMFLAECFKRNKNPFTYNLITRAQSYCELKYNDQNEGKAYIRFESTDIQQPYNLTLLNTNGELVEQRPQLYSSGETFNNPQKIKNGSYSLVITDGNGRSMASRINLNMPQINFNYTANALGTKYVEGVEGMVNDIIKQELWGEIEIDKIYIDDYEFEITDAQILQTQPTFGINVYGKCLVGGKIYWDNPTLIATIDISKADEKVSGDVSSFIDYDPKNTRCVYNEIGKKIILHIVKPCTFNFTIAEPCSNGTNQTSQLISVGNGEKYEAYINDVPTDILRNAKNGLEIITGRTDDNVLNERWIRVNDNDMYVSGWPKTIDAWNDYISLPAKEIGDFNPLTPYALGDGAYYNGVFYRFIDNFSLDEFDPTKDYYPYNVVVYNNKMYRFKDKNDSERIDEFDPTQSYSKDDIVTYDNNIIYNKAYQFEYTMHDFNPISAYTIGDVVSYNGEKYTFKNDYNAFSPNSAYTSGDVVHEEEKMFYFVDEYDADEYAFNPNSGYTSGSAVHESENMFYFVDEYVPSGYTFSPSSAYTSGNVVLYDSKLYSFVVEEHSGAWNNKDAKETTLSELVSNGTWNFVSTTTLSEVVNTETWDFVSATTFSSAATNSACTFVTEISVFEIPTFNSSSAYTSGNVVAYDGKMYRFIDSFNIDEFNPLSSYTQNMIVSYKDNKMYQFESYFHVNEFDPNSGYTSGTVVTDGDEMYVLLKNISLVCNEFNPLYTYYINERVSSGETVYEFLTNLNLYRIFDEFNPSNEYIINNVVIYDNTPYQFISEFNLPKFDPNNGYTSGTVVSDDSKMYVLNNNVSLYKLRQQFVPTNTYGKGSEVSDNYTVYKFINGGFESIDKFNASSAYTSGNIVSDDSKIYVLNDNISLYRVCPKFNPSTRYSNGNRVTYDDYTIYQFTRTFDGYPEFDSSSSYFIDDIVSYEYQMYQFIDNVGGIEGIEEFNPTSAYASGDVVTSEGKKYSFAENYNYRDYEFNSEVAYKGGDVVVHDGQLYKFGGNYGPGEWDDDYASKTTLSELVRNNPNKMWNGVTELPAFSLDKFNPSSVYTSGSIVSDSEEKEDLYVAKMFYFIDNYEPSDYAFSPLSSYTSGNSVYDIEHLFCFVEEYDSEKYKFNPSSAYTSGDVVHEDEKMFYFVGKYDGEEYEFSPSSAYTSGDVVHEDEKMFYFEGDYKPSEYKFNPSSAYTDGNIVYEGEEMFCFVGEYDGEEYEFNPSSTYTSGDVVHEDEKMFYFVGEYDGEEKQFNSASTYNIDEIVVYNEQLYKFIETHEAGEWNDNDVEETTLSELVNNGTWNFVGATTLSEVVSTRTWDFVSATTLSDIVDYSMSDFVTVHAVTLLNLVSEEIWNFVIETTLANLVLNENWELAKETSLLSIVSRGDEAWDSVVKETELSDDIWNDIVTPKELLVDWSDYIQKIDSFNIYDFNPSSAYTSGSVVSDDEYLFSFENIYEPSKYEFNPNSGYTSGSAVHEDENLFYFVGNYEPSKYTFSPLSAYTSNDAVVYDGQLYKFIETHEAGEWNDNDVEETTLSELVNNGTWNFVGATTLSEVVSSDNNTWGFVSGTSLSELIDNGTWDIATKTTLSDDMWSGTVETVSSFNIYDFNSASTYHRGDIVSYNGKLYEITVETHSGEWNSSDASATTLSDKGVWSETILSDDRWSSTVETVSSFNIYDFDTATTYYRGDIILYNSNLYEIIAETHSGEWNNHHVRAITLSDKGVWREVPSFKIYKFDSADTYYRGNVVYYESKYYVITAETHTGEWNSSDVSATTLSNEGVWSATTLSDKIFSDRVNEIQISDKSIWNGIVVETKLSDGTWEDTVQDYFAFDIDEFDPTVSYSVGDIVAYSGQMYQFIDDFALSKFNPNSAYTIDSVVTYNGDMYIFNGQRYFASAYTFNSASAYTNGAIVLYDGELYEFMQPHVASTPWSYDETIITYLDELSWSNGGIWTGVTKTQLSDTNVWGSVVSEIELSSGTWADVTTINDGSWNDYVVTADVNTYRNEISSAFDKAKILSYELEKICKLSKAVYDIDAGSNTFTLTTKGGKQPILYRSFSPAYSDDIKVVSTFTYSDDSSIPINSNYPNIVGYNYGERNKYGHIQASPQRNNLFKVDTNRVGNYLASFTNNGGYVNDYATDPNKHYTSSPPNANGFVNIGHIKTLGEDEEYANIPSTLIGYENNSRYYRLMSVDRRQDFTLHVIAPILDENLVNEFCGNEWERVTMRGTNVVGRFYNGIEMSYDASNNIISANTPIYDENANDTYVSAVTENGTVFWIDSMKATTNHRLEYTYSYPSGSTLPSDVNLYLNKSDGSCSWVNYSDHMRIMCSGATKYDDETGDITFTPINGECRIIPMYRALNINGVDSRLMIWSYFNNYNLSQYVNSFNFNGLIWNPDEASKPIEEWKSREYNAHRVPFYILPLVYANNASFNGIHNFGNYPLTRYINVLYKEFREKFNMTVESCKYEPMISIDNIGRLSATVRSGKKTEFTTTFKQDVRIIHQARKVIPPIGQNIAVRRCSAYPYDKEMKELYKNRNYHEALMVEDSEFNVPLTEDKAFSGNSLEYLKNQYMGEGNPVDYDYSNNGVLTQVSLTTEFIPNDSDGFKYYPYIPQIFSMRYILSLKSNVNQLSIDDLENLYKNYGKVGSDIDCGNDTVFFNSGDYSFFSGNDDKIVDSESSAFSSMQVTQHFPLETLKDESNGKWLLGTKRKYIKNRENHIHNEISVYSFHDVITLPNVEQLEGITVVNGNENIPFTRGGDHLNFCLSIDWDKVSRSSNEQIKREDSILEVFISNKHNYRRGFLGIIDSGKYIYDSYYLCYNGKKGGGEDNITMPYDDPNNPIGVLTTVHVGGNTFHYATAWPYMDGSSDEWTFPIKHVHIEAYITSISQENQTCYKIYSYDRDFYNFKDVQNLTECIGYC